MLVFLLRGLGKGGEKKGRLGFRGLGGLGGLGFRGLGGFGV